MGILDYFKENVNNKLVDKIIWNNKKSNSLMWISNSGLYIKYGAKLYVGEKQVAVISRKGKIIGVYESGVVELSEENMPMQHGMETFDYNKEYFKANVYFFSKKKLKDKWFTNNYIHINDSSLGRVKIKLSGDFTYRVSDNDSFINNFLKENSKLYNLDINKKIANKVGKLIADYFNESKIRIVDLMNNPDEFSLELKLVLKLYFLKIGVELINFELESINLPDDIQMIIDYYSLSGEKYDMLQTGFLFN